MGIVDIVNPWNKAADKMWGTTKSLGGKGAGALGGLAQEGLGALGKLGPATADPLAPVTDHAADLAQSRAQQQAAFGPLSQWALTGNGPSAAQAQLQSGKDQSIAAAMSMAKSMPGANQAAQQRMAAEGGTMASQQAANQAAQLRAQEQQAAMQNYLGMIEAQRKGDIELYKAYSDAHTQTQMANAQGKNGFWGGVISGVAGIL